MANVFYGVLYERYRTSKLDVRDLFNHFKLNRRLSRYNDKIKITIYTGDTDTEPKKILQKARNTFNVAVDEENVDFVFLTKRKWVQADPYPHFTLLGQSLGSLVLGMEALLKFQPGVFNKYLFRYLFY